MAYRDFGYSGYTMADDAIEKIGIDHTIEQAETADFILLVLDASLTYPSLPDSLLQRMNPANTIVIENKTDLPSAKSCADFLPELQHVSTSSSSERVSPSCAKSGRNLLMIV